MNYGQWVPTLSSLAFQWAALAVGIFCVIRGVADLRARRYVWGALGVLAGLVLLLTPFATEAVKFDLGPPAT